MDYLKTDDNLRPWIDQYKKLIQNKLPDLEYNEIYKWETIQHFQDNWTDDHNARNILSVLEKSFNRDNNNLWSGNHYLPYKLLLHFATDYPGETSKMFKALYNEDVDLYERIDDFLKSSDKLKDKIYENKDLTHYQSKRSIMVYLTLRYPAKYYLFKSSMFNEFCEITAYRKKPGRSRKGDYTNLKEYFNLCDAIHEILIIDKELLTLHKRLLPPTIKFQDNYHTLTQDFIYCVTTYLNNQESEELSIVDEPETKVTKNSPKINVMPNLNQILYGPPGTGKTYHTINKSVSIANPQFDVANASREKLKTEYERLVKDGQIEFVTFHQSMSYEDFIEGIKPMEPKEGDTFLKYEIKEGIFKRLCERASKVPETKPTSFSLSEDEFQKAGFYKLSLGDTSNPDDDQIYSWCIQNGYIALGYGDAIDFTNKNENEIQQMVPAQLEKFAAQAVNYFIHYLKTGDYIVVTYGNLQFRAIGKVTGNYEYKNVNGLGVHQFRKVEWLLRDIELPYEEVYNKQFSQQTIYRLDKREVKKDFFVKAGQVVRTQDNKIKNYVLIIDEINRGNVSQIFGELITLIEEDKRAGKDEALTATLPYSKKTFFVPSNLYIIGTMNTADRSVEALDTALRRRFSFSETASDPSLLDSYSLLKQLWIKYKHTYDGEEEWEIAESAFASLVGMQFISKKKYNELKPDADDVDEELNSLQPDDFKAAVEFKNGVNLELLLTKINERLIALLDRDHTIGHAWLMNVFSLEGLKQAFKNKILPLLQEFFYNDYAKIGLVLGKNFFIDPKPIGQNVFAKFDDGNELALEYTDKIIYTLKDPSSLTVNDFISIYQ